MAAMNTLSRVVLVDRTKTAAEVINATGRVKSDIDERGLAEMPLHGKVDETVEFFELDYNPTVMELDYEYKARGLRPDPAATAQAMTDDPAFTEERPVVVQWRDGMGSAYCMVFYRHHVDVRWRGHSWLRHNLFAGVRK